MGGDSPGTQKSGERHVQADAYDDLFFCSDESDHDRSEQNLPDDFHAVLAMMGEALHDTVTSPEVAGNFGCLPEQLLESAHVSKHDAPGGRCYVMANARRSPWVAEEHS